MKLVLRRCFSCGAFSRINLGLYTKSLLSWVEMPSHYAVTSPNMAVVGLEVCVWRFWEFRLPWPGHDGINLLLLWFITNHFTTLKPTCVFKWMHVIWTAKDFNTCGLGRETLLYYFCSMYLWSSSSCPRIPMSKIWPAMEQCVTDQSCITRNCLKRAESGVRSRGGKKRQRNFTEIRTEGGRNRREGSESVRSADQKKKKKRKTEAESHTKKSNVWKKDKNIRNKKLSHPAGWDIDTLTKYFRYEEIWTSLTWEAGVKSLLITGVGVGFVAGAVVKALKPRLASARREGQTRGDQGRGWRQKGESDLGIQASE